MRRGVITAAAMSAILSIACHDGDRPLEPGSPPDPCVQTPCSPQAVIDHLVAAYRTSSFPLFDPLLHDDYVFYAHSQEPLEWDRFEELRVHRRMFDRSVIHIPEPVMPPPLRIYCTWTPVIPFEPMLDLYPPPFPVYDPARWSFFRAVFSTVAVFVPTATVGGRQYVVVAQDLTKARGEPGAYTLFAWQDLGPPGADDRLTWTEIKRLWGGHMVY